MKKSKHVYMKCPNCGTEYERMLLPIVDFYGRPVIDPLTRKVKMALRLPRVCPKCGCGLERRVERVNK